MERLTYEIMDGGMVTDKENVKEFEIEDWVTVYAGNAVFRLAEYENTGLTPEQIMELKVRDTAKAPTKVSDSGVRYTDDYICPNCGKHFIGTGIAEFCYHCGQRLKWEEL